MLVVNKLVSKIKINSKAMKVSEMEKQIVRLS